MYHSIDKQISTLKAFDILNCDKPGKYYVHHHKVSKDEIASFMVFAIMTIDKNACYTLQKINSILYLFPFEYCLGKETLLQDERFVMSNIGGEQIVTIQDEI